MEKRVLMKNMFAKIVVVINVIGLLCLIYYAIPYVMHNTTVRNPDAMIPFREWERSGILLTIGLQPLAIANIVAFFYIGKNYKAKIRWLFLAPCILCACLVAHYWIPTLMEVSDTMRSGEIGSKEVVSVITQSTDGEKEYQRLYNDGGAELLEEGFLPDKAEVIIADNTCFSSEIEGNKIITAWKGGDVLDLDGNSISPTKEQASVLKALAENVEHEIIEAKIFEDKGAYFAAVQTNVNWQSPCHFYQYKFETKSLEQRYTWDDVDVLGVALPGGSQ